MIKIKYLKKVQERLAKVNSMLDRGAIEKMLKHRAMEPDKKTEVHNKMEAMRLLFEVDVPALLEELTTLKPQILAVKKRLEDVSTARGVYLQDGVSRVVNDLRELCREKRSEEFDE